MFPEKSQTWRFLGTTDETKSIAEVALKEMKAKLKSSDNLRIFIFSNKFNESEVKESKANVVGKEVF
ncbi:hypothetical protein DLI08_11715 [Vibrio parahaemolyticus]|nr:hypothetical protein [Vibrio parahaemolyticus]EGX6074246.1 hypothetical protein [Vibrio parahaemolyticus]